jgi:hypothetical protein
MKTLLTVAVITGCAMTLHVAWSALNFDHTIHAEQELDCDECHQQAAPGPNWEAPMPEREVCLDCHDDEELPPLPPHPASHGSNYRYEHQFVARADADQCVLCHRNSEVCTVCHHGENVDYIVHDRNWAFQHPLTFYKGIVECTACHDVHSFCQDCHTQYGALPANHYYALWPTGAYHGSEAKIDLTTCLQCHDGPAPVCVDCHGEP